MRMNFQKVVLSLCLIIVAGMFQSAAAKTVEYDLYIDKQEVNFTGVPVEAMTVNGSIPGPTITLTEGDFAKIRVHNQMDVETSVHWHGILLPNREDGVPFLTTAPILPHSTHLFQFPIIQSGTYWYHSHSGLQEQRGVYGSIVIHSKNEHIAADHDYVLVLSDWTDENPNEVLRTLKRGSSYYSLKKGSMQSLSGALKVNALSDVIKRSLQMMPPMDLSDVGYDAFLANGKKEIHLDAKPGEKVRIRIINAAASTYFYLQFAGGPMQVISSDGLEVNPLKTDRLLIAIAETYDVLVTLPIHEKRAEFRATAQDGSGFTSLYLGNGDLVEAPDIPKPQIYKMTHGEMDMDNEAMGMTKKKTSNVSPMHYTMQPQKMPHMPEMGSSKHKMEMSTPAKNQKMAPMTKMSMAAHDGADNMRPMPPYKLLTSPDSTALDPTKPLQEIKLTLTGDMERYVWSFDNKVLTEADKLLIKRGENIRITFTNKTMMHHPLHLHGHFFRVINGQGDSAPLKHTVDIPPMGMQVIEFYANEEKDWFLHCHILYHMKAGMSRVVSYQDSEVDQDIAEARKRQNFLNHDSWYAWGEASILSNMTEGELVATNTRNSLTVDWENDINQTEFEGNAAYGYYFNRFLTIFTGFTVTDENLRGIAGFKTVTPLLIDLEVRFTTEGEARVTADKNLQLTDRLSLFGESQYDSESKWDWHGGVKWTINKNISAIAQYHSEFDAGVGISIRF